MYNELMAWILTIVLTCTACTTPDTQQGEIAMDQNLFFESVYAASAPEIPAMVPYPIEDNFIKEDGSYDYEALNQASSAWAESKKEARELNGTYDGKLDHYLKTTFPELLKPKEEGANAVCSPINIWLALAMTAETAGGTTRRELLNLLGADSVEELRKTAAALWRVNFCNDGACTLNLGASLWLADDFATKQNVLDILANYYYAYAFRGAMSDPNYSKEFKAWLNAQTGGLLEGSVESLPDFDKNTLMALATTVYFKAKWQDTFAESNTYEETFRGAVQTKQTDFMHRSESGTYYWSEHFGAVGMGFENAGTMWFILPDEGVTPESLIESGEAIGFMLSGYDEKHSKSKHVMIDFAIPKFDIEADMDLADKLTKLGAGSMFGPNADFSTLTDADAFIGAATHDARVKIDEEGCEAAAFTVMLMCGTAMPPDDRVDFKLDRPFLFFITGTDGLPLFCGIVNQID